MSLPQLYLHTAGDDSLMAENGLLFRPSTEETEEVGSWGMAGTPIGETTVHSDTFIITLLLSIVCTMIYWRKRKRALVAVQFCILGALMALIASHHLHLPCPVTPDWVFVIAYALILGAYLGVKQVLYHWVHHVFFSKAQRAQWRRYYSSLLMVETAAFYPIVLLFAFLPLNIIIASQMFLLVLLFVKIWLLWRCFSVFFQKKHFVG